MLAALLVALLAAAPLQPAETVAAIQIQGNTVTPDEEMRRLADVHVGMPFDATTVDAVTGRLKAANISIGSKCASASRRSTTPPRSPW
jgi:hypothetical protein